ncbi:MAG: hypothetical protein BroJett038_35190 [Chloroflexota bacterium]|nr:MAG: hypothetical protein BroJett038_35190 [Chloroflexota bacterium]
MHINPKSEHDPIADFWMVDGYMRWALEAAREQIGDEQLAVVLRRAGLEAFIRFSAGNHLLQRVEECAFAPFNL